VILVTCTRFGRPYPSMCYGFCMTNLLVVLGTVSADQWCNTLLPQPRKKNIGCLTSSQSCTLFSGHNLTVASVGRITSLVCGLLALIFMAAAAAACFTVKPATLQNVHWLAYRINAEDVVVGGSGSGETLEGRWGPFPSPLPPTGSFLRHRVLPRPRTIVTMF
jgi:hypothetical protein